jgi:hydroxyacylglutathione hydrolase
LRLTADYHGPAVARASLEVVPLRALDDNYVYAVVDRSASAAAIVDPGEARPAIAFLERERLALADVLVTHHHGDHTAGIAELVSRCGPARVVGAASDRARIAGLTHVVREGDRLQVLGREAAVLDLPGHTRGHVGYVVEHGAGGTELFSGDTIFGATIGNLFEGTPDDMLASLSKVRRLPERTRIWCGHEYTLAYVREAARFDPDNPALAERLRRVEALAARGDPTVPLTLAEECATSPFFRWDDPALASRLGTRPGAETFRRLCDVL